MTEGTSNNGGAPEAPRPETRPAADAPAPSSSGDGGDTNASGPAGTGGSGTTNTGPDGAPKKRRRRGKRGGKRHRKKPATGADGSGSGAGGTDGAEAGNGDGDGAAKPQPREKAAGGSSPRSPRSSSGGGRQRPGSGGPGRSDTAAAGGDAPAAPDGASSDGAAADAPQAEGGSDADASNGAATGAPRRRRGRRGGRGRGGSKKPAGEGGSEDAKADDAKADDAKADAPKEGAKAGGGRQPAKKSTRTGGGRSSGGGSKDAQPASTRLRARQQRRGQRGRRPHRKLSEEEAALLRGQDKTMLIHQHEERTQIAVLEEGALIEHYVARAGTRTTMAGNVYLGKVQNVLPGMEAAFIDFGRGRNGVLYAGEVNYSAEDLEGDQPKRIENVLKSGQKIMVQVTKDPIGNKGARLTTQVSLAGRYLVLAPDQAVTGISKRLAETERNRLRQILRDIRPDGHGVIVRTAAEGASAEALKRDLDYLVNTWDGIKKDSKRAKAPSELHGEPGLIVRVVRDEFSDDFTKLVVDTRDVYEQVKSYLESSAPDLLPKLELHEGALPLFEEYHVSEQLQKALERKVWLPSGGSIIIERTEALTVIDVNTGKFTGKGSNLEETVFANNLEAAEEIARQLRLRDIGGIIVIDFIDMIEQKNQREMLRTFKRHLAKDKTRSQVFEVSNLGLVEMTRKKVSEGLLDAFSEPCPNCDGRGIVITHEID